MSRWDLDAAVAALARGEVVAAGTDTVMGLLCDPRDPAAVERVYELKRRPAGLELILLAARAADLEEVVAWSPLSRRLAAAHWPGPLTVVLPVAAAALAIPRSGSTLGVRVPRHNALRQLLARTGPLASTSANRHGEPPARNAAEVRAAWAHAVLVVLEGGGSGRPSTVVDCCSEDLRILRQGAIDEAALAAAAAS